MKEVRWVRDACFYVHISIESLLLAQVRPVSYPALLMTTPAEFKVT